MFYQKVIKPLFFALDAELSHNIALKLLQFYGKFAKTKKVTHDPIKLAGIDFPNRVGLAAGLDKNGIAIDGLASLGFGFLEVGTVTPKPQSGNPKPRLFRLKEHYATINRMGFNNQGVEQLVNNVRASHYKGVLGINIGKNATTPMESAIDDYLYCLDAVYQYAHYVTVNISSPNTKNLRDLQSGDALATLVAKLKNRQLELQRQHNKYTPIFVKIAPDLTDEQIQQIADVLLEHHIDGVIATNTTNSRENINSSPLVNEQGGLSGEPLKDKSLHVIKVLSDKVKGKMVIIGCGGIASKQDMRNMLDAGADLIQLYTAFIYQGPELINHLTTA